METTDPQTPLPSGPSRAPLVVLAVLLALSAAANVALFARGPQVIEREVQVEVPAPLPPPVAEPPACPPPVECPVCEVCPEAVAAVGTGAPRPPRVDEAAAAEGEAHVAHAEAEGERDPVQLAAQRRMVDGVDRIVSSHSAAAAERFLTRNLPSLASMDCAFRDPAVAEHARMRLREMNELARPQARLTEEQLVRYERDLRCPRQ